jgi:hypothetical protein
MTKTTRIAASALAIAALGIAGSQTGANATAATDTCTHGVEIPSSGHNNGVTFLGSRDVADTHIHEYRHHQGLTSHKREVNCPAH